eukprot:403338647
MQKQLHIYPTIIALSYLGAGWSIKSQLLNRQQRQFVVKKVQSLFPQTQYIIDLHPQSGWKLNESKILTIANNLCFKIYDKTTIQVLYQLFNSLINPEDPNKPKSISFKEPQKFTQLQFKMSEKKDLQELVSLMFNPKFNEYFQIVETVFVNSDLTIDSVFFSRVLNVPKVELYSSKIDCKNLNYKLENIESLNQQEGSFLDQDLKQKYFSSVKSLILVNNVEKSIAIKYPNIEYLYINEKKREDKKPLHFGPKKCAFPNLKKVHLDKRATLTNIENVKRKIEQFSNVGNVHLIFKLTDASLWQINAYIKHDYYQYDKFKIGQKHPQFFLIYKRKNDGLVYVRIMKYN